MLCKQCGQELRDGAVYCSKCGVKQNREFMTSTQNIKCDDEIHNGKVGFIKAILLFFKNYVNFNGRASKSEFWWAFLFNIIVLIPLSWLSYNIVFLGALFSVVLVIPGISLTVRRLHDVGKSGIWWFVGLVPLVGGIVLLVLLLKDSDGNNQWGVGVNTTTYDVNMGIENHVSNHRTATDNDIYLMIHNHEPVNLNSPDAKIMMDSALSRIIPTYTGIENLVGVMMLCDPQTIKLNITCTDTDTLIVVFKALEFYVEQGCNANILGKVQKIVLETLKTRF